MKLVVTIANKVVYDLIKSKNRLLADIILNWGKIAGLELQKKGYAYKIVRSKENGKNINILYIAAKSSAAALSMAYNEGLIIERINKYLGYGAVNKIKCRDLGC